MPTPSTPYARLLASINSGGTTSGGIVVNPGDVIQLSAESYIGWSSNTASPFAIWELYDFPSGFSCPSGWSTSSSGTYQYLGNTQPPSFTWPLNIWGKLMSRLTVCGGIKNGNKDGTTVDESTAFRVASPKGVEGFGLYEGNQFHARDGWVGALKASLKALEASASFSVTNLGGGAKGDGVTDDYAALQAAIDIVLIFGGGELVFPAGIFVISQQLLLKPGVRLRGMGSDVTIIKAVFASDVAPGPADGQGLNGPMILAAGTYGASYNLTANVVAGALTFDIGAHALVKNDHAMLTSWDYWRGITSNSGAFPKGERIQVASAGATTITVRNPLVDFYKFGTAVAGIGRAKVVKINRCSNVGIRGMTLQRSADDTNWNQCLRFYLADNVRLEDVKTLYGTGIALSFDNTVNVVVDGIDLDECFCPSSHAAGLNEGIAVSNGSEDIRITNFKGRRGITLFNTGKNSDYGIPRRINITNFVIDQTSLISGHSPVECHWVSEDCVFVNGTIRANEQAAAAFGLDGYSHEVIGCTCEGAGVNVSGGTTALGPQHLYDAVNSFQAFMVAHFLMGAPTHLHADATGAAALSAIPIATDDATATTLLTGIRAQYVAHAARTNLSVPTVHINAGGDGTNSPPDLAAPSGAYHQTLLDAFTDFVYWFDAHLAAGTWHGAADVTNVPYLGLIDYETAISIRDSVFRMNPQVARVGILLSGDGDSFENSTIDMQYAAAPATRIEESASTRQIRGTKITGNLIENAQTGMEIYGAKDALVLGNTFRNIGTSLASGEAIRTLPSGAAPCSNVLIDDNHFADQAPWFLGFGIHLTSPARIGPNNVFDMAPVGTPGYRRVAHPDPTNPLFEDIDRTQTVTGTYLIDSFAKSTYVLKLIGNTVFTCPELKPGPFRLVIKQDATGTRLWTPPASFNFLGASSTLTTTANKRDLFEGFSDGVEMFITTIKNNFT